MNPEDITKLLMMIVWSAFGYLSGYLDCDEKHSKRLIGMICWEVLVIAVFLSFEVLGVNK